MLLHACEWQQRCDIEQSLVDAHFDDFPDRQSGTDYLKGKRGPQCIELPKGEKVVKLRNASMLLQWMFLEIISARRRGENSTGVHSCNEQRKLITCGES